MAVTQLTEARTIENFMENYHPRVSEYCSAIIDQQGAVWECVGSHLQTMIQMSGDPDYLMKVPDGKAPLLWMTIQLHCVLVDYENQIFSEHLTPEQEQALDALEQAGLIVHERKDIHGNC